MDDDLLKSGSYKPKVNLNYLLTRVSIPSNPSFNKLSNVLLSSSLIPSNSSANLSVNTKGYLKNKPMINPHNSVQNLEGIFAVSAKSNRREIYNVYGMGFQTKVGKDFIISGYSGPFSLKAGNMLILATSLNQDYMKLSNLIEDLIACLKISDIGLFPEEIGTFTKTSHLFEEAWTAYKMFENRVYMLAPVLPYLKAEDFREAPRDFL